MFGSDVVVSELQRFTQGQFENFFGPRSEGNMAGWRVPSLADNFLHLGPNGLKGDAERFQRLGSDALAFVD